MVDTGEFWIVLQYVMDYSKKWLYTTLYLFLNISKCKYFQKLQQCLVVMMHVQSIPMQHSNFLNTAQWSDLWPVCYQNLLFKFSVSMVRSYFWWISKNWLKKPVQAPRHVKKRKVSLSRVVNKPEHRLYSEYDRVQSLGKKSCSRIIPFV